MSAAVKTAPKAAKASKAPAQPPRPAWREAYDSMVAHICPMLNAASESEEKNAAGYASELFYRLPAMAVRLLQDREPITNSDSEIYDACALLDATLARPDDGVQPNNRDLVTQASAILHSFVCVQWVKDPKLTPGSDLDDFRKAMQGGSETLPPAAAPSVPPSNEFAQRRELSRQANLEQQCLMGLLKKLLDYGPDDITPEPAGYVGLLSRIEQLNEIIFFAMRLHGDDGDGGWGENDNLSRLTAVFRGSVS